MTTAKLITATVILLVIILLAQFLKSFVPELLKSATIEKQKYSLAMKRER